MIVGSNGSGFLPRAFFLLFLFLGIVPALFSQEDDLEFILNEVAQRLGRRDFSSALEYLDKLHAQDAETVEILIIRAGILNSAGRTAEAKKIAESITVKEPDNTDALMLLADAAAIEGKDRERRTFLERVIKIKPNHARALTDLGGINLGNKSLRTAAGYFDRALAAEPANGDALVGRAIVHRYNKESKISEQLLNRAINEYPQWARPLHERARLYSGAGYYNDALEDLNAANKLEPDNYWIAADRGILLMEMNRKPEALEDFSRAVKIDPNNFIAYVYSAGIRNELGDFAGAERDYIKLAKLKPEYYFAFEGLGIIRMKNKQWTQARDAFLDAYRQAPKEYTYALLAAINWMRAGKQSDPKQFLAQVLKTVPKDSVEYTMLRLFHDLSGDLDAAIKIENEKNIYNKARMLFYLASYYDVKGNKILADKYYLLVQELDAAATIEWQLNEKILAERGIGLRIEK
jgi:tetratricopeptide (TPR) repeat protein